MIFLFALKTHTHTTETCFFLSLSRLGSNNDAVYREYAFHIRWWRRVETIGKPT